MKGAAALALVLVAPALAGCATAPQPLVGLQGDALPGGFTSTAVFPGSYKVQGTWSHVLHDGSSETLDLEVISLQSERDGADLDVLLFRPDVAPGTKVPVIAQGSPYLNSNRLGGPQFRDFVFEFLVSNFVPHGFAVAFIPVRGTADQGGCMDFMGPAERADLDQAVTWLGSQGWSNGNVGMIGLSCDGSTTWEVASLGNPHLRTIVPIAGVPSMHELLYHNGSAHFLGVAGATAYYTFGFVEYNPVEGTRSPFHAVDGVACPESWEGILASLHSTAFIEQDPGGFWADRDSKPGVERNYNGSVFLVHGLRDWLVPSSAAYPWMSTLEAKGLTVKHMLGQWNHAYPDRTFIPSATAFPAHPRLDWAEILLHWFGYWLRGDTTIDLGPRVEVHDSSGAWRVETEWPPADAVPTRFYLAPGRKLANSAGGASSEVVVAADPDEESWNEFTQNLGVGVPLLVDVTPCAGCTSFATDPVDGDFRFAGRPTLHATVTPTTPAGHLTAYLYVTKNGGAERVGRAQIDLRVADGGTTPKAVVPFVPLVAKLQFQPLDVVVPAGSSLLLVVSQGANEDRLPTTPAPVRMTIGRDASALTVHAFERGAEAFFEAPGAET